MHSWRWTIAVAGWAVLGIPHLHLRAQEKLDAAALAAHIDRRLEEKWQGVQPAAPADDAEFLRRLYLDLTGRIPRVQEIRDFLEEKSSNRRSRVVDQLLENPGYVRHFSNTWWNLLVASANPQAAGQAPGFRAWLQEQLRNETPYDKMVRDLLTAPLAPGMNAPARRGEEEASASGFLQANELKPENLAASSSRIFLGVKLECAQCHDHPFARWSRAQFWELAAFFSTLQAQPQAPKSEQPKNDLRRETPFEIKMAGTDTVVRAKFPTGAEPNRSAGQEPRAVLATWLTSRDNPYFARAAVNRLWAHFFGVGLIDPVDDEPTDDNPIRYPELLAELTAQFVAHHFDIKYLIRAITTSRAYQRTSLQSHATQADPRAFARMAVRGLTAEQIFDSIALATGFKSAPGGPTADLGPFGNPNTARGEFLSRFAGQERATERQTSILQALTLMNGKFVTDATSLERSATLAAVADASFMTLEQKIETLYLAALSRPPRPEEWRRLAAYVGSGGARGEPTRAQGDVFWALLNSSEFILNH